MKFTLLALVVSIGAGYVAWLYLHDQGHQYKCAEILGPHPTPNHWLEIPPHYSVMMTLGGSPDFSVFDGQHRPICDAQGKDVKP